MYGVVLMMALSGGAGQPAWDDLAGEHVAKYGAQFQAHIVAQLFEPYPVATCRGQNLALRGADIGSRIDERAVNIEQVNRIAANHSTGLSPPSMARWIIFIGGNPWARNESWKSRRVNFAPRSLR